ncbi:MAG: GerMN domain-containing protein [Actinobacteria bacterium]|nr:GerMN domain-containing protein [Actinomycetota bacterium]
MKGAVNRLLAVGCAVATLGGCSLDAESTPRPIAQDPLRVGTEGPGTDSRTTGVGRVFLQRSDATGTSLLVAVQRDLNLDPTAAMRVLLEGPANDEQDSGLRTAIPRDTRLLSTRFVASGTVQVDITSSIFSVTGDDLVGAVAQIVLTLVDIEGIDRVSLVVDGETTEWPRGDGTLTSRPLTKFDFPGRALSSQPDYPAIVDIER